MKLLHGGEGSVNLPDKASKKMRDRIKNILFQKVTGEGCAFCVFVLSFRQNVKRSCKLCQ